MNQPVGTMTNSRAQAPVEGTRDPAPGPRGPGQCEPKYGIVTFQRKVKCLHPCVNSFCEPNKRFHRPRGCRLRSKESPSSNPNPFGHSLAARLWAFLQHLTQNQDTRRLRKKMLWAAGGATVSHREQRRSRWRKSYTGASGPDTRKNLLNSKVLTTRKAVQLPTAESRTDHAVQRTAVYPRPAVAHSDLSRCFPAPGPGTEQAERDGRASWSIRFLS